MRNLAITLTEKFGRQFNNEINGYLSTQWTRSSSYENCEFGLNDLDEVRLNKSVLRLIKGIGLNAEQFLNGTMIRAYVDSRGSIAPLFGIKPSLYADLMSDIASVDVGLLYEGDEIEYLGKSKHLTVAKRSKSTSGDSIGGFINGITKDGEIFSLLINGEQWLEIVNSYKNVKCNNTLFVDKEWDENIQKGFLFHRLIDEFIGSVLNDECIESYDTYRALVEFENAFYAQEASKSELVFSKRGYKLGETVKLFGDVDVLAAVKADKTSIKGKMKVVVDNSKTKRAAQISHGHNSKNGFSSDQIPGDDENFVEWGGF